MPAQREPRDVCAECGRLANVAELSQIAGHVICSTCAGDRKGQALAVVAPPDGSSQTDFLGKRCCSCSADVSQAKRFRDDHGYWCEPCHLDDLGKKRVEKEVRRATKRQPKKLRCLECGTKTLPADLTKLNGLEVCPACVAATKQRERQDKERASHRTGRRSRFRDQDESMTLQRKRRNTLVAVAVVALIFLSLWQNGVILGVSPQ
jgi:hypothetical protein